MDRLGLDLVRDGWSLREMNVMNLLSGTCREWRASDSGWLVQMSLVFLILGLLLSASTGLADGGPQGQMADVEGDRSSAWRPSQEVATELSVAPSSLQSAPSNGTQAPILVPLPAPMIGAASGLAVAWLLRKRVIRG